MIFILLKVICILQENGFANGIKKQYRKSKESFEEVPLYTAVMTFIGFYMLMFLGYLNQLCFSPKKVAAEKNREVSFSK